MNKKKALTLAEILITLVIIGIVAAMTIPSLMVKLDKVVKANQIKVFESKLQKGMDAMNLAGEIGPYYSTTEDFVKALSAHMKIVTICKAGELDNCFPYESIQVQGLDEPVKVKDITTGANFGLSENNYPDVAGMVLADGTPMLLSWNVNCPVSDPDTSSRAGSLSGDGESVITTACIKGIYDLNGTKGPNKMLKDILGYGGVVKLKEGYIKIAGMKISKILPGNTFQSMSGNEICDGSSSQFVNNNDFAGFNATTQEAINLGIKYCGSYSYDKNNPNFINDYWAGAVRACGGVKYMPTMQQLADLANILYARKVDGQWVYDANIGEHDTGNAGSGKGYQLQKNETYQKLVDLGFSSYPSPVIWSGEEVNPGKSYALQFSLNFVANSANYRYVSSYQAICLAEPNE